MTRFSVSVGSRPASAADDVDSSVDMLAGLSVQYANEVCLHVLPTTVGLPLAYSTHTGSPAHIMLNGRKKQPCRLYLNLKSIKEYKYFKRETKQHFSNLLCNEC